MNSQHYPSLELCKKLPKDICNSGFGYAECQWLGVQHDPVFISKEEFYSTTKSKGNEWIDLNWIFIECPSIAEMLDVMPKEINGRLLIIISYGDERINLGYGDETKIPDKNGPLPNALAEMILFLHENNYISFSK